MDLYAYGLSGLPKKDNTDPLVLELRKIAKELQTMNELKQKELSIKKGYHRNIYDIQGRF